MRGRLAVLIALGLPATALAQAPADTTYAPRAIRLPEPLTLADAVELARRQGIAATLSRVNAQVANARVGERRAELLPFVAGSASYARQTLNLAEFGLSIPGVPTVTDPFNLWRLQLRGAQTLFDASAFSRVAAARDSVVAAGLDVQAAGNLSGATAGLAYLRLMSAEFTVKARLADSVIAADLLEQARQLTEAGVSPSIDRTRNEVNAQAVRGQLVIARNTRDRARLDLLRAMFLPLTTPVTLPQEVKPGETDLIPTDQDQAVAFALEHRPDYAAERQRTEVAMLQERAIKQEHLPSLGATGYVQQSGQADLEGSWNVQVGLQVPILDGFRRQYRTQEQKIRVETQQIRQQDLALQIDQEARQAVIDLASAREQVEVALERLRLAERELAESMERFQAGVTGSVETTQAQASLAAARDAAIQAGVTYGTARVAAYRALGVLDQLK